MKEICFCVALMLALAGCSDTREYTPHDQFIPDLIEMHGHVFAKGIVTEYQNQNRRWRFFVIGTADEPGRVVVRRNDGFFFSAANPKGLALIPGIYVRLVIKRYYTGISWETSYLEITSLE